MKKAQQHKTRPVGEKNVSWKFLFLVSSCGAMRDGSPFPSRVRECRRHWHGKVLRRFQLDPVCEQS